MNGNFTLEESPDFRAWLVGQLVLRESKDLIAKHPTKYVHDLRRIVQLADATVKALEEEPPEDL